MKMLLWTSGAATNIDVYETSSNVDEAQHDGYFHNVNIEQKVVENEEL